MNFQKQLAIITAAASAPSPDNRQPWRFRFEDTVLFVSYDMSRACGHPMFDFLSLGAAIENASLAASQVGYSEEIDLVGLLDRQPVAVVRFKEDTKISPLANYVVTRRTDRRPYSKAQLKADHLAELAMWMESSSIQVDWVTERKQIQQVAKLIAASDCERFQDQSSHSYFCQQFRFKPKEVRHSRDGLDVRLLALPRGGKAILRCLCSWTLVNLLNKCRLSWLLSDYSRQLVLNSGAVAVLSTQTDHPASLLYAGRAMERLWLAATGHKISVHPLGSLPASPLQSAKLEKALPAIAGRKVAMLMRLGYSEPWTGCRSLRRKLEDIVD